MKIANHHDKQYAPSEISDQDRFFEPGFWYYTPPWVGTGGIGLVVGREWEYFMALFLQST